MQIGMSSACFYPLKLEDTVPLIGEMGVRKMELFVNAEGEFSKTFGDEIRSKAAHFGVEIISVHPYTSLMEGFMLFSEYDRRTREGLMQYQKYFEYTAALGAKFLTFHGETDIGQTLSPEQLEKRIAVYHQLCHIAQACGITFTQENVAWCKSGKEDFLRLLFQRVPELKYTLDIKQSHRAGRDYHDFINVLGNRIVNVHINDYNDKESCLLPGEGLMDYREFFRALHAVGYQGDALIEVYRRNFDTYAQMKNSWKYLCNMV